MYIIINIIANIAKLSNSICQLVIILAKQNKIFINLDFLNILPSSKKAEHQYFQAVLFSSVERKTTKTAFLFLIYQ